MTSSTGSTAPPQRVGIIGAGISGLAYADVLQRLGYRVALFERAERVGGVWARAYPDVNLQNTGNEYRLSSFPWPFPPEQHPTGTEILRYLDALVAARGFDVRLLHEVVQARRAEGGGWTLQVRSAGTGTSASASSETTERVDHLVVSIGQYTEGKHRPELPGEAEFCGRVVTERDVKNLSVFDDKRVVVVGFGKSALDMATLASGRAAQVHQVFRTARWTLPRTVFGVHLTWLLFNRFGSVMMPSWTHPTAAERLLHRLAPLVRGFWAGLQSLVRHLARREGRGFGEEGEARLRAVLPDHPLVPDLRSAAALAPIGYYRLVGSGKVLPRRAEVTGLSAGGVRLSTGEELAADLVVLAVGSRSPTFPFLEERDRALLESESDGVQLYRHLVHPRIPDLAFAGYNHGFMHVPAAEIGALWLAALWRGELALPPVEEMERAVEHVQAWKRANIHFEPSRSCAVNTRFQQYLDVLLKDLGVSSYRKLPNVIAEVFDRYGAADYAGVVEEYLARRPSRTKPRRPLPLPT